MFPRWSPLSYTNVEMKTQFQVLLITITKITSILGVVVFLNFDSCWGLTFQAVSPVPSSTPKTANGLVLSSSEVPLILKKVESHYKKAGTLTAKFTQVTTSLAMKQKKTSQGEILFSLPNKIRWETTHPDRSLLITNGRKIWHYTPPFDEGENGQLIEKRVTPIQSRLAQLFISAAFSQAKGLLFREEEAGYFVLSPKSGKMAGITRAKIHVNASEKLIDMVQFEHEGGNKTEISLSNIELGNKLESSIFKFVVPANTDVIKE